MNKKQWAKLIGLLVILALLSRIELNIHGVKQWIVSYFQAYKTRMSAAIEEKSKEDDLTLQLKKLEKKPYDNALYQLLYQTFIYNARINEAYQLAKIAVKKKKEDLIWHKRLAQTALWVGDNNTGMKEWLYIAHHTDDPGLLEKGADTAILLGYDGVAAEILSLYLQIKSYDIKATLALANAKNRLNEPHQALLILDQLNAQQPTREAYVLKASIYEEMDESKEALKTWLYIDKTMGIDVKTAMAEASIYCMQNDFTKALERLKKASSQAKSTNIPFWQMMADLSWRFGDRSAAILSLTHLLPDKSSFLNLIELERNANPQQALRYSLTGFSQYHAFIFLTNAIQLATQLKQWSTLITLLSDISPKKKLKLQNTLLYWEAISSLYESMNAEEAEIALLMNGIRLHPEMLELRVRLLFLFITKGNLTWVKYLMQDGYVKNIWQNPIMWKVYADAFVLFNQINAAIIMYQQHLFTGGSLQGASQTLIDYGHLLEKIHLNAASLDLWRYLWNTTLLTLGQSNQLSKATVQTLSQIAPYFTSGTIQVRLLNTLFEDNLGNDDLVILLNWMVPRNYFELLTYFKHYYFNNVLPAWAGTNLALAHNDLPTLQKTVENADKSWSRGDLINAAVRLENTPLAIELLFDELTERPQAHEIYSQFTQYAVADANKFSIAQEYEKFVDIIGPRTQIDAKFRLNNTWRFQPSLSDWQPQSTDLNLITNVPTNDLHVDAKFLQKIKRGHVAYMLSYRDALNGFIPVSITGDYQIASEWTATFKLGYNQENFQNAAMREGVVQDQINLGARGNLTKYDVLQIDGQALNYYGQDRHYLADGYILQGLYEHKFWLSYPDYTIGAFGNIYHFNRNGTFGGDVTRLFPSLPAPLQNDPTAVALSNAANYQQLIPDSYSEGGFTVSFGNTILDYSHRWRPYVWAALYYNTITALSQNIRAGLIGSVFGGDTLLIYAEYGTAPATQTQTNYLLGLRYSRYY